MQKQSDSSALLCYAVLCYAMSMESLEVMTVLGFTHDACELRMLLIMLCYPIKLFVCTQM